MSDRFETAYKRARERIGEDRWVLLPIEERQQEVTEELRRMDRESDEERGG